MIKQAGIVIAAVLSFTSFGWAQNEGRWDVSLNAAALIAKQTSGNGTVQIPTTNVGFLGTARFRFQKKSALEVNWGHGDDSQKYVTFRAALPHSYDCERVQRSFCRYSDGDQALQTFFVDRWRSAGLQSQQYVHWWECAGRSRRAADQASGSLRRWSGLPFEVHFCAAASVPGTVLFSA